MEEDALMPLSPGMTDSIFNHASFLTSSLSNALEYSKIISWTLLCNSSTTSSILTSCIIVGRYCPWRIAPLLALFLPAHRTGHSIGLCHHPEDRINEGSMVVDTSQESAIDEEKRIDNSDLVLREWRLIISYSWRSDQL
ncbi:hypothetical protein HAX54_037467 [Datura stramonium]|uniref:Uncharacterized protein n=1 Tax=Datura stramonium TaxID=4076 RepID=A0ABS8SH97_DATST|nr:hypothetical protein [Datura stramonium]